jgi:hypothetical protein
MVVPTMAHEFSRHLTVQDGPGLCNRDLFSDVGLCRADDPASGTLSFGQTSLPDWPRQGLRNVHLAGALF